MTEWKYLEAVPDSRNVWARTDRWLTRTDKNEPIYIRKMQDGYVISPAMRLDRPMRILAGPYETLDAAKVAYEFLFSVIQNDS